MKGGFTVTFVVQRTNMVHIELCILPEKQFLNGTVVFVVKYAWFLIFVFILGSKWVNHFIQ